MKKKKQNENRSICLLAILILIFLILLVLNCVKAESRTINIGVLNCTAVLESGLDGFKKGMDEYDEGDTINYIYDGPITGKQELEQVVENFINKEVDLILTITTPAAVAVNKMTRDRYIPAVFMVVLDPIGAGIVQDLKYPGENITGVLNGGINDRRLEWLIKIAPVIKKLYIPYSPKDSAPVAALNEVRETASRLNIELVLYEIFVADDINKSIERIPESVQAVFLLNDSFVVSYLDKYVDLSIKNKLPLSVPNIYQVESGALMSYGFIPVEVGKQAARLAHQILYHDIKPADIPIETSEFFLSVNLKTAKMLELEIPDTILQQAQIIIR